MKGKKKSSDKKNGVTCSWVNLQKYEAALAAGERGAQSRLRKLLGCVTPTAIGQWAASIAVKKQVEDKVKLTSLSTFQPTHACELAHIFRRRHGKKVEDWSEEAREELVEWVERVEAEKLTVKQLKEKVKESLEDAPLPASDLPSMPAFDWDNPVQHGSFVDLMATLPANSVDLIFTDPPYDEGSVPLYPELARCAERVLKPKGSLIAYAGHYALGDIITGMADYLRFWWTLAVVHKGGNARLPGKWVFVGWKPLVWFVKGGRRDDRYVRDLIQSDTDFQSEDGDKNLHDWQQSECEASYLIEQLTGKGDVVLDPMCGSGTTLAAALRLDRVALGIDRDASSVEKSRNRIAPT